MSSAQISLVRRVWFAVACLAVTLLMTYAAWMVFRPTIQRPIPALTTVEDSFTIFVLGGSTAWGEPYTPKADFGLIARWFLGDEIGGRPIRILNFGDSGKPSSEVLDDVRRISRTRFWPRMAVAFLYIGNNEFLEFDDRHDLRSRERTVLDHSTVSAAQRERVLRNYESNLDEIMRLLQAAEIPVIASTIAVNMKDWEPNRSVLADPANGPTVEQFLAEGNRHLKAGDAEAALTEYRRILEIEPTFALAWKQAGDCYRLRGRFDDARPCYQQAIDHDGNPYRETSPQTRILRQVCARRAVPVVDATRILEEASPDGLVGFEFMWDNCHPTLEGYARIASGFVDQMESQLNLQRQLSSLDIPKLEAHLGIDDSFRRQVLASRGQYCYVASTLTWNPADRLERGSSYLEQALKLEPNNADLVCSLAILTALRGDAARSLEYWRQAQALDPRVAQQRANHPSVRQIMQRAGIDNPLPKKTPAAK